MENESNSAPFMMSFALRTIFVLASLVFVSSNALAQAAPECLKTEIKEKSTFVTNTCSEPISVPYCSTSKPIWGHICGAGGKTNVYYTHLKNLKPGEKTEHYGYTDIKSATCRGTFYAHDIKGFKSDPSGAYTCPITIRDKSTIRATASAATPARACELARELLPVADRSLGPCECKPIRNGKMHYCMASGSVKAESSKIGELKRFIQEIAKCDPVKDGNRCERKKIVSMGGIHG